MMLFLRIRCANPRCLKDVCARSCSRGSARSIMANRSNCERHFPFPTRHFMELSIEASKQIQRDYAARFGPIPSGMLKFAANNGAVDEYFALIEHALKANKAVDWTKFEKESHARSEQAEAVAAS